MAEATGTAGDSGSGASRHGSTIEIASNWRAVAHAFRDAPPSPSDSAAKPSSPTQHDQPWTVAEMLAWTQGRFAQAGLSTPRVDAEHLLAHALGCSRMQLYVHHDRVVEDEARATFRAHVRRRLAHEPVAYIEGRRGFHALGLELQVDARVLVPRPETEHLVDWLLEELRAPPAPPMSVLDVGTGSGAIALAIKHARPDVTVVAVDVSHDALEVARYNATALGLEIHFARSDLGGSVQAPQGGWAAIAANLPYVPREEVARLPPDVANFEPWVALDGGEDGLDLVRRVIIETAKDGTLRAGGALYLEIGHDQAEQTVALMRDAGYEDVQTRCDYAGIPRIVRGFR